MVFWIALWLVGAMRCPLETLGVFPADHCCASHAASQGTTGDSTGKSCSIEESTSWLGTKAEYASNVPSPILQPLEIPPWSCSEIVVFEPCLGACVVSVLPQGWQFLWRTAPHSRAPSFLA